MKAAPILFGLVFLASTGKPQHGYPNAQGAIFGHVVDLSGQPAKGIGLEALPLERPIAAVLPRAKTDENGYYRMGVPWWGRYRVYAEDRDAGYSSFTTGLLDPNHPPEITVSPELPQAEFNFQLPPKAGFLHFHLTDQRTGARISGIEVSVLLKEQPPRPVYSDGTSTDKPFLVPSNKDVLIHVTSWGYKEWDQCAADGMPIRLKPGAELTLDVALEPVAN